MKFLRKSINWIQRHRILSITIAAAIVGAVVFGRFVQSRSDGTLTEPLARHQIIESIYGIGTVMVNKSYQMRMGVISTIADLYVKEGDKVKKGDKLARISSTDYRAPFDGTITFLPFKIGENVFANETILSLVDLADRYLLVSLEQQGALRIKSGQKVKMSFDTIREQNYDGEVQSVYSNAGNFIARINIAELPERILPWMTADVAISIRVQDNALLVPIAAIEKGHAVWRKRGHTIPQKVQIKLGVIDKEMAEALSDELQPGDQLLIRRMIAP